MRNIIINLQNSDPWEIQLTIAIKFISSKDTEEQRVMNLNSDNISYTSYNDANEVVNESLRSKYQDNLETSMKGSDFIFDSVQLIYCKCHEVNFKLSDLYIDSPKWINNKKATINPKNEEDKYFHYAATVALNYEDIKCNPEIVSNVKLFINKYN